MSDSVKVKKAAIEDKLNLINTVEGCKLDCVKLNNNVLGSSIDDLPTKVSDGDVIKLYSYYLYNVYYYLYDSSDGTYYHVSDDLDYTAYFDPKDVVTINGKNCIEADFYTILYNLDYMFNGSYPDNYVLYIMDTSSISSGIENLLNLESHNACTSQALEFYKYSNLILISLSGSSSDIINSEYFTIGSDVLCILVL